MFKGFLFVLVMLFIFKGDVDIFVLKKLVEWYIVEGSYGFVLVGIIGESFMFSYDEYC